MLRKQFSTFKAPTGRELEAIFTPLGLSTQTVNSGVFNGKEWVQSSASVHESINPATGEVLAKVSFGTKQDYDVCVRNATLASKQWANTPAPVRGDLVGKLGDALRAKKQALGTLLSLEMGKIRMLSSPFSGFSFRLTSISSSA